MQPSPSAFPPAPSLAPVRSGPSTFLFLQGIASTFFADLGRALADRGHAVRRINFCAGDALFWRLPSDDFRGSRRRWPAFIAAYLERHGITDLILFGDCRPLHRDAIEAAEPLGVRVHVFEEGYMRPNWITMEQGGTNGYSSLPRDPDEIRALARRLPQPGRPMIATGDMLRRSVWDVLYNVANLSFPYLYPGFRRHRPIPIAVEYAGWIGKLTRAKRAAREAAAVAQDFLTDPRGFFLLPLQLDSDYQIRVHSPFDGVRPFLERTLESFAQNAPDGVRLLVKLHPLDSGFGRWRRAVAEIAARLGIAERVGFIDGGDLPSLIAASRGVVVVNSTVGMLSLDMGRPTVALGTAIYAIPGLIHAGPLDGFWANPTVPDGALMADFRRVVLHRSQVNGGYFSRESIDRAVTGAVFRLEAAVPAPAADRAAAGILSPA
jgi:capsular polysaccharide export protein